MFYCLPLMFSIVSSVYMVPFQRIITGLVVVRIQGAFSHT